MYCRFSGERVDVAAAKIPIIFAIDNKALLREAGVVEILKHFFAVRQDDIDRGSVFFALNEKESPFRHFFLVGVPRDDFPMRECMRGVRHGGGARSLRDRDGTGKKGPKCLNNAKAPMRLRAL